MKDRDAHKDVEKPVRIPPPGEIFEVGGVIFSVCPKCLSLVRVNKWLFGSLHICR